MKRVDRKYRGRYWGIQMAGWVIVGAFTAVALALVFGFFVMLLWNWLMPQLFGFIAITFWQAFGITLMARLIFGGFRNNGFRPGEPKKSRHLFLSKRYRGDFDEYWDNEGKSSFERYMESKAKA